MALTACARQTSTGPTTTTPAPPQCTLSEDDKLANAGLSVAEFDYTGTLPSSARALGERGCHAAAAAAGLDYLARVPIDNERAQSNVIFHIGQNLAMSGDEQAAAYMIAAARRPSQQAGASFDWNLYVHGSWAFLMRRRDLLQDAYDRLRAQPGDGNQTNAGILAGLLHCYDQPYATAYSPRCVEAASQRTAP